MARKKTTQPHKKNSPLWLTIIVGFFMLCFYVARAFWRWFRRQSRRTQVIVAGGIAVVLVIGTISGAVSASNQGTAHPAATATQQSAQDTTSVSQTSNQDQPTVAITQQPTSLPTTEPTAKASPTVRATPKPQPTQTPPKPTPTKPACQAVNNNPWCYNFSPGTLIYYPPNGFCNYFNCIASFYGSDDPGDGYIVECGDGTYSQSGGERGACSSHNGVQQPLYSH